MRRGESNARTIDGLWAMRGSKRRKKGGGEVQPLIPKLTCLFVGAGKDYDKTSGLFIKLILRGA